MSNDLDLTTLVKQAHDRGASHAALEHTDIGDHTSAFIVPDGYDLRFVDRREHEDYPREITGLFPFVGVRSFAAYVNRHKTADTLAYVHDVYGQGPKMLTQDRTSVYVVFDDNPSAANADHDLARKASNRQHRATLVLRPTAAARRWGAVIDHAIDQETLLDLVVDGIGEIVHPDGAALRDLAGDLHAIRTTEVSSVVRTGGEGRIELAENVQLRAGTGRAVTFPETISITLAPYAGLADTIAVDVRVKAKVHGNKVVFTLTCPTLDDALARLIGSLAEDVNAATGLDPLWTP